MALLEATAGLIASSFVSLCDHQQWTLHRDLLAQDIQKPVYYIFSPKAKENVQVDFSPVYQGLTDFNSRQGEKPVIQKRRQRKSSIS